MKTLLGLSAVELVGQFPALMPEVTSFTFKRYTPSPGLDQRVRAQPGTATFREVERLERSLPEIVERTVGLSALLSSSDRPPAETIAQMLKHDDSDEALHEFALSADGLSDRLRNVAEQAKRSGEVVAIVSRVTSASGTMLHIPVLDFHVPPSHRNQQLVEQAARHLGMPRAAILMSGRSYHLYGLYAVTEPIWHRLMLRSLLLAPIVDSRYLAHRILAGRGVLRLTASASKPVFPKVVSAYVQTPG
jgi:hypothetical protein